MFSSIHSLSEAPGRMLKTFFWDARSSLCVRVSNGAPKFVCQFWAMYLHIYSICSCMHCGGGWVDHFHIRAANMQNPESTEKLMRNKNLIYELNFDRCSGLINIASQHFSQFNSHELILCSFFIWRFYWRTCCNRAPLLVLCLSLVITVFEF